MALLSVFNVSVSAAVNCRVIVRYCKPCVYALIVLYALISVNQVLNTQTECINGG